MASKQTVLNVEGAVGSLIYRLESISSAVNEFHVQHKVDCPAIKDLGGKLAALKNSLGEIPELSHGHQSCQGTYHPLVERLERWMVCCRLLVGKVEDEISRLGLGRVDEKGLRVDRNMLEQQKQALVFLLTACNAKSTHEQKRLLELPQASRAFEEMENDMAAMVLHRNSAPIIKAFGAGLSNLFIPSPTEESFIADLYERWRRQRLRGSEPKQREETQVNVIPQEGESANNGTSKNHTSPEKVCGQETNDQDTAHHSSTRPRRFSSSPSFSSLEKLQLDNSSAQAEKRVGELSNYLSRQAKTALKTVIRAQDARRQRRRSQAIDRLLEQSHARRFGSADLIMIGTPFTTGQVFNCMKLANDPHNAFSEEELLEAREYIPRAVMLDLTTLESVISEYFIVAPSAEFIDQHRVLWESGHEALKPETPQSVRCIYGYPLVARLFSNGDFKAYHMSNPPQEKYTFSNISRLSVPDYVPTPEDLCSFTPRTYGLRTAYLRDHGRKISTNPSLTINLRHCLTGCCSTRKGAKYFGAASLCLIYTVDLLGCTQRYIEDHPDRLFKSMCYDFAQVCRSATWASVRNVILVFVNVSQFAEIVSRRPLMDWFEDYNGGNGSVEGALRFAVRRFLDSGKHWKRIFPYVGENDQVDGRFLQFVFDVVKECMISEDLKDALTMSEVA